MNQGLKAIIGLLITALAAAAKLAAYISKASAAIFDNSAVTGILLVSMAVGLFMFAYYSMPDQLIEKPAESISKDNAETQTPTPQQL